MTFEQSPLYIESFEKLDKRLKIILESLHNAKFKSIYQSGYFYVTIEGYYDEQYVCAESNTYGDFRLSVAHAIYKLTSI